jgi:hypothetical protein
LFSSPSQKQFIKAGIKRRAAAWKDRVKTRKMRNLIGPQVRRLRCEKNWTQEKLMFKLQDLGWNICRQRIARIEACEAWVSDFEILLVSTALEVEIAELMPKMESKKPLYMTLSHLLAGQVKTLAAPNEILAQRTLQSLPVELKIQ